MNKNTDERHRLVELTEENPDNQGAGGGPLWKFEYDDDGQLIEVTDPLNRVTDYQYDALGRLVTEIFPDIDGDPGTDDRPEFTYTYDEASNLVSIKDALDNVTVYGYDYRDRLTTITDPDPDGTGPLLPPVTSFTYDDANRLTRIIDPLSRVTDYQYDGLNRLIRAFYPDADGDPQSTGDRPEISYSYDALGNELSMTDALGNITSYEYDNLYRLIELTEPDPDGPVGQASSPVTSFQYDAASQLLEVTDPLARTTAYDYDGLGRVTKETYPDPDSGDAGPNSPFMDYVYDLAGNLLSQTDALGHATSYGYDNLYRMTSETDANADTVDFIYDLVGNLTTLTDPPTDENPAGNTTTWFYDGLDRVTEERNDVGDSRFFVYDLMNNLVERTDRNGRVIQFDYDQLYRRTAERWLDATETTIHTIGYTYDAASQVLSAGDVFANYGYTYDGLSRVTQVTHDIADLVPAIEMNQKFDLMNNRTQTATVIGGTADFVTNYGYDNLYRMIRVEQASSLLPGGHAVAEKRIDLDYDLAGQLDLITRFADLAATKLVAQSDFTFDLTGRLTDLTHVGVLGGALDPVNPLADYDWSFDVANRVTQFESLSDGIVNYDYDYRDQLKTADYNYQTDEDYVYDENGNRTSYSSSLTGGGQEGVVTGDLNRLIDDGTYTYAYDAEGNRTARFVDVDGDGDLSAGDTDVTLYDWDHRNRLVTITTYDDDPEENPQASKLKEVTHIYDAYNRWIGRKVDDDGDGTVDTETFFIYDGNQIVLQFDGTEVTALSHRYLWGPMADQILADETMADLGQEGDVLWPLTDNLGTVRDLAEYDDATDATAIVDHYVYDAFGNETDHTGSTDFLFKYTGRAFDEETGMQNNLNRWFDPAVGRWLSEDPIGFEAGDANVYRYVGNAPTLASDPNGLANLWNPWTWGRSNPDQSWGDFFNPAETASAFGSGVKTGTKGVVNATAKTAASTATLGFCEIDEVWEPTNRDIAQGYAISEGIGRVITEGAAGVATGALGKVGKLGKAVAAFDAAGNAAGVGRGATDIVQNGANIGNVTETLAGAAGLGGNAAAARGLGKGLSGAALDSFNGKTLHSGIEIDSITSVSKLTDPIGRDALGHTSQIGKKLTIKIKKGLCPSEESITIYHEIIEGAMGPHLPNNVPKALQELNEAGIDAMAKGFHEKLGPASVGNVNKMLKDLGF